MTILTSNDSTTFYRKACIVMIWLTTLYSSVIQFVFFQLPYGMLMLGIAVLLTFVLVYINNSFVLRDELSIESIYMLCFMVYMLFIGLLFSQDINEHLAQWITSLEYFVILIIISSIITHSGTNSFYYLLLVEAAILAVVFIRKPVDYQGRYSISLDMNPNGLGMSFATGIWAILYLYQKKKISLIIVSAITVLFTYCILLTGSRKSLIAAGLTVFLWIVICFIPNTKRKEGYQVLLSFFFMLILMFAVNRFFLSQYVDSKISSRMNNLLYEVSEGNRSDMYRNGFELLKENLLFGMGFRGYANVYGGYSHATLVEIPVSGGIIGALLYFYIYYISIKRVIKIYKITKGNEKYTCENSAIRMIIIIWVVMIFYTTCIIHHYQFQSFLLFGMIFGETSYLYKKVELLSESKEQKNIGSKYIKNEYKK